MAAHRRDFVGHPPILTIYAIVLPADRRRKPYLALDKEVPGPL
jgi:hypothetical protein